ncbi:MAG: T9SS type A sorting domain-containing protein [Candidatus Cloacimonetes bacterium]|nr:T9SS type A sorting domain-containing protein [Candidatus Cloacimonadota bacterium]
MRIKVFLIMSMVTLFLEVIACTIGVASGNVTQDGRPLIWKARDRYSYQNNRIKYIEDEPYKFVAVVDSIDSYVWMGVNEFGLSVLNSSSYDLQEQRTFGNGSFIKHALGNCKTVNDFEELLDITNLSGRITYANFGVMDSLGNVAIFEVSHYQYWKFDVSDSDRGYIIRTNFSENGGGDEGLDRYIRSTNIIEELIRGNELSYQNVLKYQLRDFSDSNSQEIEIPFESQYQLNEPYGFFDTQYSISGYETVSATVIRGVFSEEPSYFTTMYTILGHPATSVAFPYFPTGQTSEFSCNDSISVLMEYSLNNRSKLFSYTDRKYIDSFLLRSENSNFLEDLYNLEEEILLESENQLNIWRNNHPNHSEMTIYQNQLIADFYPQLTEITLDNSVIADFSVSDIDYSSDLTVSFYDKSRHNPHQWEWDFDNDGIIDSELQNPSFTFIEEGVYPITLTVSNEISTDSVTINQQIFVSTEDNQAESLKALLFSNYPNPFNPDTKISFELAKNEEVSLDIYNLKGKHVKQLILEYLPKGKHIASWDGTGNQNDKLSSGIYFIRLKVGKITFTRKTVLLK